MNGACLSTISRLNRVVIASEARQSSRNAARSATLDPAQWVIPSGLQQSAPGLPRRAGSGSTKV